MISDLEELYTRFLETDLKVCTDTRKAVENSFFICLKGENHDANLIAEKALEAGARYVLTNRKDLAGNSGFLIVEDTLKSMQDLATWHRNVLQTYVIAIGGSNGKTTTKELLKSIFDLHTEVLVTPGNFNNHIGVPLTLLQLRKSHSLAIIELGINHPDEMTELCLIAQPDEGVLTNIGKEHLEGFGSIEGVARAESELFDYLLNNNGLCYINIDDPWLANMAKRLPNKRSFGIHPEAEIHYLAKELNPQIIFDLDGIEVKSVLSGNYNFSNILTAITIAKEQNVPAALIAKGIADYVPQNNRSEWRETAKNQLLIDCYNANPSSMELAIMNVLSMENEHKLLVIGDMLEMGSHAFKEHQNILNLGLTHRNNKTKFVFVGEEFGQQSQAYPFEFYADVDAYFRNLENGELPKNNLILLKASRGVKLEKLIPLL